MFRKCLQLILLFAIALCSFVAHGQVPSVGQQAPGFSLNTPDGKAVSLSGLTSKATVVLVVLRGYPGYQCPFCERQAHDFIANAEKFSAAGAEILLVYPGPPAELDQRAREFLVKQNPLPTNVHLVVDPDYTFTRQYDVRWDAPHETAYPSTFLIDRGGRIFFSKTSKEHGDRTTAADVLTELQRHSSRR